MDDQQLEKKRIICVDEGRDLARQVSSLYTDEQLSLSYEKGLAKVVDRFEREIFDIMLLSSSVASRNPEETLEILELLSFKCPATQILFFTQPSNIKIAHRALRAGVYHYSLLPITNEELKLLIETAFERRPQLGLNMLLRSELEKKTFESMVGQSEAMQQVYRLIRQAAAIDIPVLISGETGTGKELAARAIHELSSRSDGPYVTVHLGALPSELVASELFGHEAGAFTGATSLRRGCFEQADRGTVFMDEIATIDEKMQISLLRLLESREFSRLGNPSTITADVRIIAASNADLEEEIRNGDFRDDLYYRLDVLHIAMPPLRKRRGDIHILADHFIQEASDAFQKSIRGISPDFVGNLESYSWPGNIRELRNIIQRSVSSCPGDILDSSQLPPRISRQKKNTLTMTFQLGMSLAEIERAVILRTLKYANNNRTRASEILGISRRTLYEKLKKL